MSTPEQTEQSVQPSEVSPQDAAPSPVDPSPAVAHHDAGGGDAPEEDGADEGAGDEGSSEGADASAAPGEAGAKKKRRRRRKKKSGEGVSADGAAAEGQGAEGQKPQGQKPEGQKKRDKKKHHPERERPAFNVGDVVFGKVLEATEDVLIVDLSGKAKAIFDLRELLITDDESEANERAAKEEAEEEAKERAARAAEAAANGEAVPAEAEHTEELSANATEEERAAHANARVIRPNIEEEAPKADASPPVEAAAPEAEPTLPRVILEAGAPFVGVVHNDGGRGGYVVLTHHPKRVSRAKPIVAAAFKDKTQVFGIVTGVIKGGVEVDIDGLRAFAPGSHMDVRLGADLTHLIGKRLPFAVTQYGKRGRDVVLSRKEMIESEAKALREEALKKVEIGAVVEGVVRTVVQFGAFIDIGGIEGLVPLSEMSHNRADTPRDVFKVGDTVSVKVLKVDERGKLWLSKRATEADPWGEVLQKYAVGTKHTGKVVRLQPFGAFVELEPGIDGLVHIADLSMKRIEHPNEIVKEGDNLEVVVSHVDSHTRKIALHAALTGAMADEAPQKIALGKVVKVAVLSIESNGLAVRVLGATGRAARGFVSAMATGTPRGTELRKPFPVGKEFEAKVIEHDARRGELKLSIKALAEETERNAYQTYRAQVKREAKFGTFGDLLAKKLNTQK